ncbi:hypothetical protein MKW94_030186 [Papaver nudicaule]|uniref:Chromatin modification-related protein EAF1 B-like n=1 Tax=Papaver nudicaule TaxID=74823 RepID=A0AA41RT60_PAPNU|nr:hypothetical protein [Papaver nudicaule]
MHGDSVESALLVNAEVDSMGGVIDGGVGMDTKASPRRAAIEKAQAELRQEYDVREERRRELEFLEKGGNPLDFKLGPAASISFQSTSFTDQIVTSEAKGSFALTASPPGDSVESSGRPGATTGRETNTADNLLLFDTENDIVEGERNSKRPNRSTIPPSEQSSQLNGTHNAKESEDLAIRLAVKGQAYARRNRSRTSRDGARASTTDLTPSGDGKGTSALPSSRHASRNVKGSLSEVVIKKEHPVASISNLKHRNVNGDVVPKNVGSGNQMDMEVDAPLSPVKDTGLDKEGTLEAKSDATTSKNLKEIQANEPNPSPNLIADADPVPNTSKIVSPEMPGETAEIPSGPDLSKENLVTDREEMVNEGLSKITVCNKNCIDSESSFMQIGDTFNDHCPIIRKNNTDLNPKEQVSLIEESPDIAVVGDKESSGTKDVRPVAGDNCFPVHQTLSRPPVKVEEETFDSRSGLENEVELAGNVQRMESTSNSVPKAEKELGNPLVDEPGNETKATHPQGRTSSTLVSSQSDKPDARHSGRGPEVAPELNSSTGSIRIANKAHEDSVLEEARIIEAKRKRIAELSAGTFPSDSRRKSHWDFVLEEMAWLANDFMQERLWKTTVAAQVCHMVALQGRLRFDRQNLCRMQRKVAHTLAKAIKQFWQMAEVLATRDDQSSGLKDSDLALVESAMVKVGEAVESKTGEANTEARKLEGENPVQGVQLSVQGYAVRFLKYTKSAVDHPAQAEAPLTPDRISDLGIMEWEDQLSEEILFYTVPAGAMGDYRKSVELHWSQYQKSASSMNQEELDTSMFDAVSDFGSGENAYGEYEGETGMHYLAGSSNFIQKKRKNSSNSFSGRSYEVGSDLSYGHYVENKLGLHSMGNRPSNNSTAGSIPTRRVRTASRQRFPVTTGAVGGVQFSNKTDASSGDTSSFQDDQSTVQGGSQIRKGLELESTGEFGKHLMPDCTEMKPKKKKLKHSLHRNSLNTPNTVGFVMGKGSAYEQRWSLDSIGQHEQKDTKKRMESHAFETNGNGGIGGQHVQKKLKMIKHDTSVENVNLLIGSIPSPVASQVSNLANPNKHLKMHLAQNRGRKPKGVQMTSGLLGSGSSWTQFEDQALVVLVHDMGPNWELVSDVINSTLQFKCIFRKPKDCKERHKSLMDKSAGDGADSADDSGSSQPYPSTLPGIPKGSARQLFQRLRGPMEEDTLKAHFEKIISIGQHQHSRRIQSDSQDQKQTASVHNSHVLALSQVCPNNLTGGPLTPLDLCDAASPDLPHQGSHSGSLGIANQGSAAVLPTSGSASGSSSLLQGSSGMALGNSLPSPSAAHNASNRFSGQRPSLPMDEQQRMHYNNMLSGRNLQHSGLSVPGSLAGGDRGVRVVPGSNGMGMMPGNRGTPMPRPGFQGVGPPSMLNMVSSSGSMHPATAVGMPNSVNMHNGSVSGQGPSMMRPRDMMHMTRPGHNSDDQRQMMMQELQMQQVSQGNSQGLPAFNGLSSGFSNQTAPPPGQTFPVQHLQQQQQQSHVPSIHPQQPHHPHHQGSNPFVLRIPKDRQVQQQRFLHQQQQQFSPSNTALSHGQPQSSQHPITTPLQNSSQVQQQASSLPSPNSQLPLTSSSSMNPVTSQPQSKHHLPPHGLGRSHSTAASLPSQLLKQRQRQQQQQQQQNFQQTGRHLTPQRQQSQSHQQPKFSKGMGRGNTSIMHQNHSTDPSSHVNGITSTPGNQSHEKSEQAMHHMMQNQGLFSGSNTIQSNNLLVPQSTNQSLPHQKLFSRSPPSSLSKQLPQVSSHSDLTNNLPPSVTSGHTTLPPVAVGSGQQQLRPNIHRMLQPHNRQMNPDPHMQSTGEQQPSNSRPHIGGTESSTNCMPVLSSDSSAPQWKGTSEYNSGITKSSNHLPGVGNPSPLSSTTETEPSTPSSSGQDLIHEQFSGSTPTQSNSAGTHWQPQLQQQERQQSTSPPQPPPPPPPPPLLLQKQQPPQQPQPHPQQQLQAGQSGLYAKPSNSGPG